MERSLFITPKLLRSGDFLSYARDGGRVLRWTRDGEPCGSIRYIYIRGSGEAILSYSLNGVPVRCDVKIKNGRVGFMESYECFLCPSCNRRSRKLYLPPGRKNFACSKCHNLTYKSSNDSHEYEHGYFKKFLAEQGVTPKEWKEYWREPKKRRRLNKNRPTTH